MLDAQHLAEVVPIAVLLRHGEADPFAVAAAVVVPERARSRGARHAFELLAQHGAAGHVEPLQRGHAAEMRDVHLLADAVLLAREQRRHDAVGQHDGAHLVGDAAGDRQRVHVRLTHRGHDARPRQAHVVERGLARVRPDRAVARGAGVDDLRVALGQGAVADAQLVGHAFAEILDEHVGLFREFIEDFLGFGFLQVERQAFLVAVVGLEVEVRPAVLGADQGASHAHDAAARVAADPLFDLDDFGAQVGQHHGRDRSLLPDRPVDDANPVERLVHNLPSLCGARWPDCTTGRGTLRRGRPPCLPFPLLAVRR